ncbi:MAG TPA: GH25 family lysozyme [Lachnospiraceae bacterium]|nr:GH25 family lysozyme [Lachnospiraceae bacterium]
MDSKVRNLTILAVVSVMLLVIGLVFYINQKEQGNALTIGIATSANATYETTLDDGFRDFLKDELFFDPMPTTTPLSGENATQQQLFMTATSVLQDIRVSIVDENGEPVTGQSFYIRIEELGEYKDLDQDGMIYVPELSAGDYYVELEKIDGYQVPLDPMRVTVKDQLEFTVIDDISLYICSEDEINAELEDTEMVDAIEDADETENTGRIDSADAVFGIDVSKWQKEIDWARVAASGVDFVIIRCGYRGSSTGCLVEDPYFKQNIEGARAAGIEVGVYFFTQAINNVEAVEEASMVATLCADYQLDYPVFIDTESAGGAGRADGLDAATRTEICTAFCTTLENAGYHAGVYASRNWYENHLNDEELTEFAIWDAEYRESPIYQGNIDLWQYTSNGSIDGITTRVDLNLSYMNE